MAGFCDSLHTILSVVLQFSLTFYLFSVAKSTGIFQSVLIRLLFTPCPATRCAMHRIYANRINSCDMSRVFCDLRSHKTPRGILPVNSNLIRAGSAIQSLAFFSFSLYNVTVQYLHSYEPKCIYNHLRWWHFGLYVSGFWHIHAKTPRGTVATE